MLQLLASEPGQNANWENLSETEAAIYCTIILAILAASIIVVAWPDPKPKKGEKQWTR